MSEEELRNQIEEDAGDPVFAELAELVRQRGELQEALQISLSGLSANPSSNRGRLVLARIFYELDYIPFAIRELELLHGVLPDNQSVEKLLRKLSPGSSELEGGMRSHADSEGVEEESTVAEADFNFDDIDDLGEDD